MTTRESWAGPPVEADIAQAKGERQQRFLGYWFGRQFWGRGIGTQALGLFLQAEKTRPLYADPFAGNLASVRLLQKHGFQPVETIRHGPNEHIVLMLDTH